MPDALPQPALPQADAPTARPDRKALLCYTLDAETEQTVKDGLAGVMAPGMEFMRGNIHKAIATLKEIPTPLTLIVDVAGEPQALAALEDLSTVVEQDVRVLVIGDRQDLGFYRQITRGLGVADYLYKPLVAGMVAENFAAFVARRREAALRKRGGKVVTITGARGGVGASTVAVHLGWYLAHTAKRYTVLLDADLHRGVVPLMLDIQSGNGLRTALQFPERVDELFVERSALVSSERLHALATEEVLAKDFDFREGACEHLLGMLRRRYSLIIADTPFASNSFSRELLNGAQQRVIVMEPTLAGIRDALRLLQLPATANQAYRPLLVVNRHNRRGAIPIKQLAETMRMEPDILLPDLPEAIEKTASMGMPTNKWNRAFAKAIGELAEATTGVDKAPQQEVRGKGLMGLLRR